MNPLSQFSNWLMNGIDRIIGYLDANRVRELVTTDTGTMVLPRTMLESTRGADAARETFLREVAGLIFNVFGVGLFSHLLLTAIGDRFPKLNPRGLVTKAWIAGDTLEAFTRIYENELARAIQLNVDQKSGKPAQQLLQEARVATNRKIWNGLISTEPELSNKLWMDGIGKLKHDPEALKLYLSGIIKDRVSTKDWSALEKSLESVEPEKQVEVLESKLKGLLQMGDLSEGKINTLPRDVADKLAEHYAPVPPGQAVGRTGTNPHIIANAEQQALEKLKLTKQPDFKQNPEFMKAFYQLRRSNSAYDLSQRLKGFTDTIKATAGQYLPSGVDLRITDEKGVPQTLLQGKKLSHLVASLFHFNEMVDLAGYSVDPKSTDLHRDMLQQLSEKNTPARFWHRFLPQASDSLVTSIKKTRGIYTLLPVVLAAITSASFVVYNNWLTQQKHGGKKFFPGEGLPEPGRPQQPVPSAAVSTLIRPGSAFAQFRQSGLAPMGGLRV